MKKQNTLYIPLIAVAVTVLLCACSTRKNTATSRFWQSFTTRYNVYYNGITNYNEQIKILENDYQDDYSQRLFIHPAEAYSAPKSPQPSGSFQRTIEKMQKAISLHSIKKKPKKKPGKGNDPKYQEWLKRDEYNPFLHNAWYLLAKAEYMKGDFLSSAATFHYIARRFTWKPDLVLESQIWEALSYLAMGWTTEADNVLAHVHIDQIESKRLRSLANLAMADYHIKNKKIDEAIPYLAQAVKGARGSQKTRLNFLLGQLYEDTGQKDLAYQAYKAAGSGMSTPYRTKFNTRIRQSAVFQGQDIKGEVRALRHMTRYDRNKEYLDQIYYAIGNLYLSRGDSAHAIENYKLATEKSTRNGIDKAIANLALGRIYFAQHHYDLAQPCYSEAVPQLSEEYPNYKAIKKRSDVLDELAVYSGNVTLQDSLLRLSQMTPEEQKAVVKKIIEELKKKEKEEEENAKREAYLAEQAARGSTSASSANAPQQFSSNSDKSWYFYNTQTKNQGKTQFQQRWGNRKLEDDWRRRNKNTFSLDDEASELEPADTTGALPADSAEVRRRLEKENDPHQEEYYLKNIPKTEEEITSANDIIAEGLYNMGLILKDKLEDFPAATSQFDELMRRYPDNIYRMDTYYNLYLMCMREGRTAEAETWRQLILSDFADSRYGRAMRDPDYLENLKRMNSEQEQMYAQAYESYLNNDNQAVHDAYAEMMRKYPLSDLMPKFMFIDALSYVTQHDGDKFKSVLKEMLERYPDTDITPTASAIMKGLNAGRKLYGSSSGNVRGMSWTSYRIGGDSVQVDSTRTFTSVKESKDKPWVFVLVFSTDSVNPNQLLFDVAKHNFTSFTVRDYDLEPMTFGPMSLLVVKGFASYNEVLAYRTMLETDNDLQLPQGVHNVLISQANFDMLLSGGRTFEDYFTYLDQENEATQQAKIPANAQDDAALENPAAASVTDLPSITAKPGKEQEPDESAQPAPEKPKPAEPDTQVPTVVPENPDLVVDDGRLSPEALKALEQERQRQRAQEQEERRIAEQEAREEAARAAAAKQAAEQAADSVAAAPAAAPADTVAVAPADTAAAQIDVTQPTKTADKQQSGKSARKQRQQKSDAQKQAEREQKAAAKAEKERQKAAEKAEKERQKAAEKAEKERLDAIEQAQKAREDSIKNAEKQKQLDLKNAAKAKEDSVKAARKAKEEARKAKQKERQERAKQKERERKEKQKAREAARKANQKKKKKKS